MSNGARDKVLRREDILSAALNWQVGRLEVIPVPALGGAAYMCPMSAREMDRFEKRVRDGDEGFRVLLLAASLCDASGNRLFGEEDVSALAGLPAVTVARLVDRALVINGLGGDAAVEAAVEGFGGGLGGDTSSG